MWAGVKFCSDEKRAKKNNLQQVNFFKIKCTSFLYIKHQTSLNGLRFLKTLKSFRIGIRKPALLNNSYQKFKKRFRRFFEIVADEIER